MDADGFGQKCLDFDADMMEFAKNLWNTYVKPALANPDGQDFISVQVPLKALSPICFAENLCQQDIDPNTGKPRNRVQPANAHQRLLEYLLFCLEKVREESLSEGLKYPIAFGNFGDATTFPSMDVLLHAREVGKGGGIKMKIQVRQWMGY